MLSAGDVSDAEGLYKNAAVTDDVAKQTRGYK